MLPSRDDVWADLRHALYELETPFIDTQELLSDARDLKVQPERGLSKKVVRVDMLDLAYVKARGRAMTRIAHEAIEKGLKAVLLDVGLSERQVRSGSHELQTLLTDVQQHIPAVFNDLERCFDIVFQYLEVISEVEYNTNIVDYFQEHGNAGVFVANRYASIEDANHINEGMIVLVYCEILRALMSLLFDRIPKDIHTRIEEEARNAILTLGRLDPMWDVVGWMNQGPVRPRLEDVENIANNKVLRAAVRRCEKKTTDMGVRYWARHFRHNVYVARRKARGE